MTAARATKYFWILVAVHLVVWTLARGLAQPNAPLDVVEMAYLGHEWQLGYANHPPLAAWVTEAALVLGGGSLWLVYAASQLAMIACLWAAWRLGRALMTPGAALLGALVLECCLYYHFTTSEVNNNVALYPFWALAVLVFYWALETGRAGPWLAMGACLGVGALAKYSLAMLVVPMALFLALHPRARRHLMTRGPYLAAGVAVAIVAPHLVWAARHQFPALTWALDRTKDEDQAVSRLVHVASFLKDQLPAVLPMLAALVPVTGWHWRLRPLGADDRYRRDFLLAMALGPLAVQIVLALVLDLKLRSMYGSQLWTFTGVLVLFSLALRPEPWRWRRAAVACIAVGVAMVVAAVFYDQAWPHVRGKPMAVHFPGRAAAVAIADAWRRHTDRPLRIVAGEWALAANVALYSRPRPSVYGGGPHAGHALFAPGNNPWTSDEALWRDGGMILWNVDRQPPDIARHFCERFPSLEVLEPISLRWQTRAAVQPLRVGLAFVPPGSDARPPATRAATRRCEDIAGG